AVEPLDRPGLVPPPPPRPPLPAPRVRRPELAVVRRRRGADLRDRAREGRGGGYGADGAGRSQRAAADLEPVRTPVDHGVERPGPPPEAREALLGTAALPADGQVAHRGTHRPPRRAWGHGDDVLDLGGNAGAVRPPQEVAQDLPPPDVAEVSRAAAGIAEAVVEWVVVKEAVVGLVVVEGSVVSMGASVFLALLLRASGLGPRSADPSSPRGEAAGEGGTSPAPGRAQHVQAVSPWPEHVLGRTPPRGRRDSMILTGVPQSPSDPLRGNSDSSAHAAQCSPFAGTMSPPPSLTPSSRTSGRAGLEVMQVEADLDANSSDAWQPARQVNLEKDTSPADSFPAKI
ncbi:hypothetical protein THAOC_14777, partial [Thalassiosira oceanica]